MKEKKRRARLIVWLSVLALFVALIAVANSSLFALTELSIEGNELVSDEEISELLSLREGDNLIRYFLKHFGRETELDGRFKRMDVFFDWPHAARVEVEEEKLIGCLYYQGSYLCLNRLGIVVKSEPGKPEELALIRGVTVGSFVVGEQPVASESEPFELVLLIGRVMDKYGLCGRIREINVRNPESIVLNAEGLEIHCGPKEQLDEKLLVVRSLWDEHPELKGILHIEDLQKQLYLENKS